MNHIFNAPNADLVKKIVGKARSKDSDRTGYSQAQLLRRQDAPGQKFGKGKVNAVNPG